MVLKLILIGGHRNYITVLISWQVLFTLFYHFMYLPCGIVTEINHKSTQENTNNGTNKQILHITTKNHSKRHHQQQWQPLQQR